MLTPEYLDSIEFNDVVMLYNKLNIEITADIIKRVSKMQEITSTTRNQLEILLQTNGTDKILLFLISPMYLLYFSQIPQLKLI